MANQLGGCTVAINGRRVQVNYFPSLSLGLTAGGIFVPMLVDSTGAQTVSSAAQTVTPNIVELGASATQVIPIGAKGWTYGILSGTATVNGVALAAGFTDGDPYTLAATITIITGATSSAYIRWNT